MIFSLKLFFKVYFFFHLVEEDKKHFFQMRKENVKHWMLFSFDIFIFAYIGGLFYGTKRTTNFVPEGGASSLRVTMKLWLLYALTKYFNEYYLILEICGNVVCANCLIGHLRNNEGDLVKLFLHLRKLFWDMVNFLQGWSFLRSLYLLKECIKFIFFSMHPTYLFF